MSSSREIAVRRMYGQRVWGAPFESLADVVRWHGAMQAQEFVPAKWAIGQRAPAATEDVVNRAFAEGELLRTHVVRPTWHFVLAEDIRWLLEVTRSRVDQLNAYMYRKFGLDDDAFAKSNKLLAKLLKGGVQLTRKEIGTELERAGVTASGLHLGYLLMRAELDQVICSGALNGRQQTYAYFDDRVPRYKTPSREKQLAELARRYFVSRGPATVKDFQTWSSLTVADARAGLASIRAELAEEKIAGRVYYAAASSAPAPAALGAPRIDLIQGYDELVMGYSESKDVLHNPAAMGGVMRSGEPPLLHTILLGGQMLGHWKHVLKSKQVIIETVLYRKLTAAEQQALQDAADRFGAFLGLTAVVALD